MTKIFQCSANSFSGCWRFPGLLSDIGRRINLVEDDQTVTQLLGSRGEWGTTSEQLRVKECLPIQGQHHVNAAPMLTGYVWSIEWERAFETSNDTLQLGKQSPNPQTDRVLGSYRIPAVECIPDVVEGAETE